jgi:hypothetical protein
MDKASAVNKAKTRGEKARALNAAHKKALVMESVTILVERRAPKRTRTAVGAIESLRPSTPAEEPLAGPANATAINEGQLTVLRDGWKVIQRYFTGKTAALAVSDYLDTVKDPGSQAELQKGFSAAMSYEGDEAYNIVKVMIDKKLREFGKFFFQITSMALY